MPTISILMLNPVLFIFFIPVVSDLPVRSEGEGVNQAFLSVKKYVAAYRLTGDG